jgi:hypothetical protein
MIFRTALARIVVARQSCRPDGLEGRVEAKPVCPCRHDWHSGTCSDRLRFGRWRTTAAGLGCRFTLSALRPPIKGNRPRVTMLRRLIEAAISAFCSRDHRKVRPTLPGSTSSAIGLVVSRGILFVRRCSGYRHGPPDESPKSSTWFVMRFPRVLLFGSHQTVPRRFSRPSVLAGSPGSTLRPTSKLVSAKHARSWRRFLFRHTAGRCPLRCWSPSTRRMGVEEVRRHLVL